MKKNDVVEGVCTSYTHSGQGVVKIDGYPLFVNNIIIGEKANIIVTKTNKSYGFGRVKELLTTSEHRVEPKCPLFPKCGGCQIQHMDATMQAQFKTEQVQSLMTRMAKLDIEVNDILSMEEPYYYRNKAQIPVGDNGQCGFYRVNSNDIIDMNSCLIQSKAINDTYLVVKDWVKTSNNTKYLKHILIKEGFNTKELMVVLITKNFKLNALEALVNKLTVNPNIKSIVLNLNERTDNVILGDKQKVIYGELQISDKLNDFSFNISPKSFYQVNPIQTKVLYEQALNLSAITNEDVVVDLYCGVGTISMFLAQKAKKVIGVEIVSAAIEDAKRNAALNGIDNIEFICSDVKDYVDSLKEANFTPDVVVVDPPRKGLDESSIKQISEMNPKRIVYVSCDPATLARDLARFTLEGYTTKLVQPVDMFPHTFHVETVCLLSKLNVDRHIEVELNMDELDLTFAESKATYA